MRTKTTNNERLDFVIQAKASYHRDARALSCEEKIASIERMRQASKIIKSATSTGGGIAQKARQELEAKTGKKVINGANYLPIANRKEVGKK